MTQNVAFTNPSKILQCIDDARECFSITEDPGLGTFEIGEKNHFKIRILEHEGRAGPYRRYFIIYKSEPICMTSSWGEMLTHMKKREKPQMAKLSRHDQDLRESVRLKCKNDWGHDLTEDEISMCIIEMEQQKLSLFHNQIWPNKRVYKIKSDDWSAKPEFGTRITWDKTIDGYRAIAHRSGLFCGIDQPVFENNEDGNPLVARITVYRLDRNGNRVAITGEARFEEFVQLVPEWEDNNGRKRKTGNKVPNSQWSESPHNQLAVAAERQALRKAFQDCEDTQSGMPLNPQPSEPPEKPIEESRGSSIPDAFASRGAGAVRAEDLPSAPVPTGKSTADPEPASIPAGKSVEIPQGGYKAFMMYEENRIMLVGKKGDDTWVLALDNGERIVIESGHETSRGPRRDDPSGGRRWKEGDRYYDGATVEKVADSKNGGSKVWLALDDGSKVLIDKWGKQEKRKPRKKPGDKVKADTGSAQESKKRNATTESSNNKNKPDHKDVIEAEVVLNIEELNSVEEVRQHTIPLLKEWCDKIFKKRISPKQAYSELTGVVLQQGQTMTIDDFKVLYTCLKEQLDE